MEQTATVEVVVGRVGRAHGLRGDVVVEVRTDEPDERFGIGATVRVEGGK
ncbi:ribosome maturation factor RimM, partial [Flavobacterium sp. IR1]